MRRYVAVREMGHFYFNSHTPCGVRRRFLIAPARSRRFQLTHPMRGATQYEAKQEKPLLFQLTHPMRGATYTLCQSLLSSEISTHTPHAGCDPAVHQPDCFRHISTHTPHAGCDRMKKASAFEQKVFQLTHPMRGATTKNND